MKRLLLCVSLLSSGLLPAQENWTQIEANGFNHGAAFRLTRIFQNRIYVAGDSSSFPQLYSSSTGAAGSFTKEAAFPAILQGKNETAMSASAANGSYLFFGSAATYDTSAAGGPPKMPQVYRFDGTQYKKHGLIPYTHFPASISYPRISSLALYSPTGSNDTIYAFVYLNNSDSIEVWKAPAISASPTWKRMISFAPSITGVNDAIVWHKKLYIACSSRTGGMILRTSNGVKWDTVATALSMQNLLGANYSGDQFKALEIYKDTLMAGMSGTRPLWYTADSLLSIQSWKSLMDTASYRGITNMWFDLLDLQSGDGKLWVQVNYSNLYPRVYLAIRNKRNKDTLLTSTVSTPVEVGTDFYNQPSLNYFNNSIFFTSFWFPGARHGNAGQRQISSNTAIGSNPGEIFRFNTVNPTAGFIDTVQTRTGFCAYNTVYLVNTTVNGTSYIWYKNGVVYSHTKDTTFTANKGEVDTFKLVAYNGTYQSLYKDSVSHVITIHSLPTLISSTASKDTVCQGQPDTLKVRVTGGKAPYTYVWHNVTDNITYLSDSNTVIQLYTVPQFSPYVYLYVNIKDANQCVVANSPARYIWVHKADSLSGVISDTSMNPVSAGKVYLFKKKLNHVGLADSAGMYTLGANGAYYFPGLYYGDYYLKAVADTGIALYKTAVGTYYSNKANAYQWDSALVIQQYTCKGRNNGGKNIKIIQIPAAITGPGDISGVVSKGPGYGMRYGGGFAPMGAPLKGVDVKLGRNPSGGAAARTTTDNTGHYNFHNIPLGNYKIYVDIPNFGMDSVRSVVINSTNPNSIHNDYYVDSNRVRVVPTHTATATICQGDSIKLGGAFRHNAGVYYDTLHAQAGYDSLIRTTLSITPLPTVSVSGTPTVACSGSNVTLSASGGNTYIWSVNAGSATTTTVQVNPTAGNNSYTVTGTATATGCSNKATVTIAVNALPYVTASASADTICAGSNVTLAGGGANTYTWTGGVVNWIPFTPTSTATYTVTGTNNNNGCKNSASVQVVVNSCVGIRQIAAAGVINVYPIPATNSLFIELGKNAKMKLLDIAGQVLMEQNVYTGKNEINVAALPAGAYNLMLNANGNITYVKVMINK